MKHPPFLPIGSLIYNRDTEESFELTGMLGQGGFAQCFSVKKIPTQEEFAVKIIKKTELARPKNKQKLLSEIKIHLSVQHKNIVKLYTYFEDKEFVYLVMEMCHNKSMMDLLKKKKKIEEKHARVFLLQMISALDYLHKECSVVHRDMKLANLFLDKNFNIKVGDFGLAAVIEREERKKTICGTPNYIAPEILFNYADGHSFEVDIWSVGVILYTMIVGKPPFQKSDIKEIYRSIKENKYTYPEECIISQSAKDLINGLLELDPKKRMTFEEIYNSDFVKDLSRTLFSTKTERVFEKEIKEIKEEKEATKERKNLQISENVKDNLPNLPVKKKGLLFYVQVSATSMLEKNPFYIPASRTCPNDYVVHTINSLSRYGLGYVLASGGCGILFNDCTSIVLREPAIEEVLNKRDKYVFEYLEHKVYGGQKIITKERHSTEGAPNHLKKKILLIPFFVTDLFQKQHKLNPGVEDNVFVVKHVNFARGPILRLSNRVIVFFIDDKAVVFFSEGRLLFFDGNLRVERELLLYCQEALNLLLMK